MWHRKPIVAGSFYPGDPDDLNREIDRYLAEAGDKKLTGSIVGVISPHAGYIYSGPVAAHSFNELKGLDIDVAVVLAPSHRARFAGASVIPEGIYGTPLGEVTVDAPLGGALVEKEGFAFIKEAHQYEHSLEVQVPFLQRVLGSFSIVPIVVGTTEINACRYVAAGISAALAAEKRRWIMVISTDLSHYHSYAQAKKLDGAFVDSLRSFDIEAVERTIATGKAEACGEGPVLTGLTACRDLGARGVEILKYANSGDTAGGRDQVVGYLAAAIVG
ncbi:MAG: AmmeMemoRadiSam system protein B [Spirochaetes bacterium]|nr:AmmeMemoRadiSam system protein B [Spirochaetota bacterium]